jgi:hypothetical protein
VSALKVKWWDVEHACEPPDIDEFSDQKARWQCSTCKSQVVPSGQEGPAVVEPMGMGASDQGLVHLAST